MIRTLTCNQAEELLADYIDRTLDAAGIEAIENHFASCGECAELARDAAGVSAFYERVPSVDPPLALMNRIVAEVVTGPSRQVAKPSLLERLLGGAAAARVLAPRFAMGLAMSALSIGMFIQITGVRSPARVWRTAENRVIRAWDRAMKGYENLAAVEELQNQFEQWRDNSLPPDSLPNGAAPGDGPRQGQDGAVQK
jgi:anti-sigma factor RsiW